MDSRLLFKKLHYLLRYITWDNNGEYGWIHINSEENLNLKRVCKEIQEHLGFWELYLIIGRRNSGLVSIDSDLKPIKALLGKDIFSLWNMEQNKIIEFNKDVIRKGVFIKCKVSQ